MLSNKMGSIRQLSMQAWCVEAWGAPLKKIEMPVPVVKGPNQVLVKVKAASLNPIDTLQCKGYGDVILSKWKMAAERDLHGGVRLPFVPGKDCAGVVEEVGPSVTRFQKGDKVMGVIQPVAKGTLSEYALLEDSAVVGLPDGLSFEEGASLPYVACTTWAALNNVARLNESNARTMSVLINGGSGGVGTFAIQLLTAWQTKKIVVTCSPDSFETMRSMGAIPIDYHSDRAKDQIVQEGPFDVVLSCVDSELSRWTDNIMSSWKNSVHVSIVSPMLNDTDRYGLIPGLFSTAAKYFTRSCQSLTQGKWFSYAYFLPNLDCLQTVYRLVQEGKLKPVVEKVVPFDELVPAFEKVAEKKGRGKTVIRVP